MADETQTQETAAEGAPAAAQPADEIKNLKAEMNRKLSNLEQTNAQLLASLEALKPKAPKAAEPEKKVSVFEDEEAYTAELERRVESRIESKISARTEVQGRIQQLYADYPELQDGESSLAKKANEYFKTLPEAARSNPAELERIVLRSAIETGVKPKSMRPKADDNDSFALGGNSSGGNRPAPKKDGDVNDTMLEIGKLMGIDYSKDKKRQEALKEAAKRKNWTQYK